MGMDLYGTEPTSEVGSYFRANVWWWHPLAEIVEKFAPEQWKLCEHWHTNDGDGLDGDGAAALAAVLDAAVDDESLSMFMDARKAALDELPDKSCNICAGTGERTDTIGMERMHSAVVPDERDNGQPNPRAGQIGTCNGCSGAGVVRPWATNYPASIEFTKEFIAFLHACGGFRIC